MAPAAPRQGLQGWRAALGIGAVVAAMLFLALMRPPQYSVWWAAAYELGHAPLFGLVALGLRVFVGALAGSRLSVPAQYGVAFLLTLVLSIVSEVAQIGSAYRDANVADAVRDVLGGTAGLLAAAGVEGVVRGAVGRTALVVCGLSLMVAVLAPLGPLAWSYSMRRATFPLIADFTSDWQRPLLKPLRVDVSPTVAPDAFTGLAGEPVLRVRFRAAAWPGLDVIEPWPDWRGYDALRFKVYAEEAAPRKLVLRIDDEQHDGSHQDRFNRPFEIPAGVTEIVVPLADIRDGPRGRQLDLSRIARVLVFSQRPEAPYELLIGPIRLETSTGGEG